ncbi:hypodermin-B-like [Contarinia nasturtii]|uniref:hypodermin-B-like n=1 Tax=Contarinia nasturtii TaxID=265458 RepID=UPI0012D46E1F|nr:hypodermin-B-like [Contarinia nasturtii]
MFVAIWCVFIVILNSLLGAVLISPRINGGQDAEITQFPFMASLRELRGYNQYKHLCGSVIISQRYLLTVAQCFSSEQVNWFGIAAGTSKKNEDVFIHRIRRVATHEKYDAFVAPFMHDIALIELEQPLTLSERINVISLNTTFYEGHLDAVTLGFGGVYDNIAKLQSIKMKTMTNPECRSKVGKDNQVYDFGILCAYSGDVKRRIGHGDAGGPLVHQNKLIGLISWNPKVVGSDKPEGFTRISSYNEWIAKHMK